MSENGFEERSGDRSTTGVFTVRIRASWLRTASVVLAVGALIAPLAAYAADGFNDVPDSNIFHDDISWLADADVTKGCNPPDNTEFCPDENVTREQMAAFMRRLAEGEVVNADTANTANSANSATTATTANSATTAGDADRLDGNDINEVRYPSVLPAGETIVGHLGMDDEAVDPGEDIGANIDFGIDVGSSPTTVYVASGDSDPDCTGSTGNPTAPPGYLCVYEQYTNNATFGGFLDLPGEDSARFGNIAYFTADASGDLYAGATWAVTAPTSASFSPPSDAGPRKP